LVRKRINFISSLARDDGTIAVGHDEICNVAKNYLTDMYCYENVDIDPIINYIPSYFSSVYNDSLLAPFFNR